MVAGAAVVAGAGVTGGGSGIGGVGGVGGYVTTGASDGTGGTTKVVVGFGTVGCTGVTGLAFWGFDGVAGATVVGASVLGTSEVVVTSVVAVKLVVVTAVVVVVGVELPREPRLHPVNIASMARIASARFNAHSFLLKLGLLVRIAPGDEESNRCPRCETEDNRGKMPRCQPANVLGDKNESQSDQRSRNHRTKYRSFVLITPSHVVGQPNASDQKDHSEQEKDSPAGKFQ